MMVTRNYYKSEELPYMVNCDADVLIDRGDSLRSFKFKIEGVMHGNWVYGMTHDTTSGRPHFVFYAHIVAVPEFDRLKITTLFKLLTE